MFYRYRYTESISVPSENVYKKTSIQRSSIRFRVYVELALLPDTNATIFYTVHLQRLILRVQL